MSQEKVHTINFKPKEKSNKIPERCAALIPYHVQWKNGNLGKRNKKNMFAIVRLFFVVVETKVCLVAIWQPTLLV